MDENQKIAAMRASAADGHELSLAKTSARFMIRRYGVVAAGAAFERALRLAPPPHQTPAPTVAAATQFAAPAAISASDATELSKRMPYQPTALPPRSVAVSAQESPTDQPTDAREQMRLAGLAAVRAAAHPR